MDDETFLRNVEAQNEQIRIDKARTFMCVLILQISSNFFYFFILCPLTLLTWAILVEPRHIGRKTTSLSRFRKPRRE